MYRKSFGFTIVELLIVVVVIAILAAITVVAYTGVRDRTVHSSLKSSVQQVSKKIHTFSVDNAESFPASLADIGVIDTATIVYDYIYDNSTTPKRYCIQATTQTLSYYMGHNEDSEAWATSPTEGRCREAWLATATVKAVSAGYRYYCVLNPSQDAYCSGRNEKGQLGDGTTTTRNSLVAVDTSGVLAGKSIKDIQVGGDMGYGTEHTCVLASDNQVYCWGANNGGELGNGDAASTYSAVPVAVDTTGVLAGKTVKSLKVGYTHSCVIASDDQVYCWGGRTISLNDGQLGNGTTVQSRVPVAVNTTGVLSGKTIKHLAVGTSNTCVIASDDLPYCWGYTSALGVNTPGNNSTSLPLKVDTTGVLSGKKFKKIMISGTTVCVVSESDGLYCWGSGYLGNGTTNQSKLAVSVTKSGAALKNFYATSANNYGQTLCYSDTDKKVYCWGKTGQSNDDAMPRWNVPTEIVTPADVTIERFSTTGETWKAAYGIGSDGKLYFWRDLLSAPTVVAVPW